MTKPTAKRASTRVSRSIKVSRETVYQAFLDPVAVAAWLPPESMRVVVLAFDAREGGRFRMSLIYEDADHPVSGKTSEDTDTVQGRFSELIPYEKIVEIVEFESQDPAFAGEMRLTASFADVGEGTVVTILCEDIPKGIRLEDNEQGCKESLEKLAALLERQK